MCSSTLLFGPIQFDISNDYGVVSRVILSTCSPNSLTVCCHQPFPTPVALFPRLQAPRRIEQVVNRMSCLRPHLGGLNDRKETGHGSHICSHRKVRPTDVLFRSVLSSLAVVVAIF